jgi:hypothetical protein
VCLDRIRDLTKEEVEELPEVALTPPATHIVYSHATGTWEGCGFDSLDKSASSHPLFEGPHRFSAVARWYRRQLASLGWPQDVSVNASGGTRWHRWVLGAESIDLIDRVIQSDDAVAKIPPAWRGARLRTELPPGWWSWCVQYKRRPHQEVELESDTPRLWTPGDR